LCERRASCRDNGEFDMKIQREEKSISMRCPGINDSAGRRLRIILKRSASNSTRGSAAVLLTVLFSCMILLVAVLFAASKAAAEKSCVDAALQLAGRSVLSEYDKRLFADYGVLAFKGDGTQIEKDIAFYADASLKKNKMPYAFFTSGGETISVFDCAADQISVNLKEFSIMNVDLFEKQISAVALSTFLKDKIGGGNDKTSGDDPEFGASRNSERTLRNAAVIESLPSAGLTGWAFPDLSDIDLDSMNMLGMLDDRARVGEYIIGVFKYANGGSKPTDTFFSNEVEYILSGKMNDGANYKNVKDKVFLLRFALNNMALLQDRTKVLAVKTAAASFAVAFGIGELIAEGIITESWVLAETKNDLLLLEEGKKVAFAKTTGMWALQDIEKVLDGLIGDEAVVPAASQGQRYEDYLRFLLFLTDRETKLLRMMDLMQINLKGTYNRAFHFKEYYAGFRFEAKVKGKVYAYTERYAGKSDD
jgi:hypothetical protein